MRVRWLHTALDNLDAQAEHVRQYNPQAAARQVLRVFDAVSHLADHPLLGREGRIPGTRELVIAGTPYVVAYRISEDVVEIVALRHSAQQWPPTL